MIAKTKFQKEIVKLNTMIPALTQKQKSWAHEKCLPHKGTSTKTGKTSCLDCGHKWTAPNKPQKNNFKTVCPNCNTQITVTVTKTQTFKEIAWFCIIQAVKGHQIVRYFQIEGRYKAGKPAQKFIMPVSNIILNPNGETAVVGRVTAYHPSIGYYWAGAMELRNKQMIEKHNFTPDHIYPYKSIIPELKRAGVKNNTYGHNPLSFYQRILKSPKVETLLKAGQTKLITTGRWNEIENHWKSIKICIRNNYTIKDAITWLDYISLLEMFQKDTRNAKYVCPENLKKEHDRYVKKKIAYDKARKFEELREQIHEDQKQYEIDKKKFFGLKFDNGPITISVMNTVQEVMEAGVEHKHCVFVNKYHRKKDSLLLAAKINGELIETVQLSLETMKIQESQGYRNRPSKHNRKIKNLVYSNIKEIERRARAK